MLADQVVAAYAREKRATKEEASHILTPAVQEAIGALRDCLVTSFTRRAGNLTPRSYSEK